MQYQFKLPDGWVYRKHPLEDAYEFYRADDPAYRFKLTDTALQVHGDHPEQLVKIIRMQMDALEVSASARSALANGAPLNYRHAAVCTTPYYCQWARKHLPDGNKKCYCQLDK